MACPSRELLDQAFVAGQRMWADAGIQADVELFRCHAKSTIPRVDDTTVLFATPQMMHARARRRRLDAGRFDAVVFDEAHFAPAPTYAALLSSLREASGDQLLCLGLSATPGRADETGMEDLLQLFGRRLLKSSLLRPNAIRVLQARGILSHLDFQRIPVVSDVEGLKLTVEGKQDSGRTKVLETSIDRNRAVTECCERLGRQARALVFAGSVAQARGICAILNGRDLVRAAVVTGDTPLKERESLLRSFELGHIQVMVNKSVLATGFDCPAVSSVVLAAPVGSAILFEQIVGRASRGPKMGGADRSTIWQLDNNLGIHGYPESYHRYEDYDW